MVECAVLFWFHVLSVCNKSKDNLRIIIIYLEKWGGRDVVLKKIGFEKVYENWKVKRLKGFNGGFFIFIEKGENMLYELKESMCKSNVKIYIADL